jgi:hypothetical protein
VGGMTGMMGLGDMGAGGLSVWVGALSFFLYGIFWRLSSIGTQRHSSYELIALLTAGLGGPTLRSRESLAAYFRSEWLYWSVSTRKPKDDTVVRRT